MIEHRPVSSVQCDLSRDYENKDCGDDGSEDLVSIQIHAFRSNCVAECSIRNEKDHKGCNDAMCNTFQELDFVEKEIAVTRCVKERVPDGKAIINILIECSQRKYRKGCVEHVVERDESRIVKCL